MTDSHSCSRYTPSADIIEFLFDIGRTGDENSRGTCEPRDEKGTCILEGE